MYYFRIILLVAVSLCSRFVGAQTFFIEPQIQSKVHWTEKRSTLYLATGYSFDNVNYEPIKFATHEVPPIDYGIMFGYRFKKGLSISTGIIQETPQLLYVISFVPYDTTFQTFMTTEQATIIDYFFNKLPLNFHYQAGEFKIKKTNLSFAHTICFRFSIIRNPKVKFIDTLYFSSAPISRDRELSSIIAPFRVLGNFPMIAFNYGIEIKNKGREIFTLRTFVEFGFRTLCGYSLQMDVTGPNYRQTARVRSYSRGSGFGFQIARKFNFRSQKKLLPTQDLK